MKTSVVFFGQLSEIIGKDNLEVDQMHDTDQLVKYLQNLFPGLSNSKYIIAVNKEVIEENTKLNNGSIVALLPPFSGG